MTKKKETYKLKSKNIPFIVNNNLREDNNLGGTKLVYLKKTIEVKEINIFGLTFQLPSLKKTLRETKIFLRPFKKNWDAKRNKLSRNFWGRKNHPLTNIWVELYSDYDNVVDQMPIIKNEIKDHKFVKNLKEAKKKFVVIYE